MKKRLTRQEEFDILKIVIDKFILLGISLLGYGLFKIIENSQDFTMGFIIIIGGVILLIILIILFIKEYEFEKR